MTPRLEQALDKLYTALYTGKLNPECCTACAVGTICDTVDAWKHFTDTHGSLQLNYVGKVNEGFGRRLYGYLPSELLEIEAVFLKACGYELALTRKSKRPQHPTSQETLYNGMRAVIAFLCELDGVQDVMEIEQKLLHTNLSSVTHATV